MQILKFPNFGKNKILKFTSLLILVFLLGVVYTLIHNKISKDQATLHFTHIEQLNKSRTLASGRAGKFPILIGSENGGTTWEEISLKNWFLFPSESNYTLNVVKNTIWIHEMKPCITCDFSNEILNIYYSHDSGKSWTKINLNDFKPSTNLMLRFFDAENGQISGINKTNAEDFNYYHTTDGGKTWNKGSLPNLEIIKKENAKSEKMSSANIKVETNNKADLPLIFQKLPKSLKDL